MNAPHEARLYVALQVLAEDIGETLTSRMAVDRVAARAHIGIATARTYLRELRARGWAKRSRVRRVDHIEITRAGMAQLTSDEVARATIKDEEE